MLVWFLFALGLAIADSLTQVFKKLAVSFSNYHKFTITIIVAVASSALLFFISYLVGMPKIDSRFWVAVLITGILNAMAYPILLRAYEIGEFSSVYSMILLTPVFLLLTAFIIFGEAPSPIGIVGVLLIVVGLWLIMRLNHEHERAVNFVRGNLLGVAVALIWSVTANFDKLAVLYSDRYFAAAVSNALIAISGAIFVFIKYKKLLVRVETNANSAISFHGFIIPGIVVILALAGISALANILHNSALLTGFVSYTIAIKRLGILFGVLWGWLFFHEKDIARKFFGIFIAFLGVIAILLSK